MSECTYDLIPKNITLACQYVKEYCSTDYIDFYAMNYCLFDNRLYLTIPILLIILIISFFLLSDTSNRYLSSALTIMSDKLKMSQNLAGVTLLALGNGAPDVISGIVATGESGGVEFTVGSLFGGGVFVTCIVFSSVVLFSDRVQLTRPLFIRDVLLYMLALIILIIFSLIGRITIYQAIGFFSLYVINVIVAFCQDRKEKKNNPPPKVEKKPIRIETTEEEVDTKREVIIPRDLKEIELSDKSVIEDPSASGSDDESSNIGAKESETIARALTFKVVEYFRNPHPTKKEENKEISEPNSINQRVSGLDESLADELRNKDNNLEAIEKSILDLLKDDHFYKNENTLGQPHGRNKNYFKKRSQLHINIAAGLNSIKYRLKRNYFGHSQSKWEDKGFFEKIFYVCVEFPLVFLRDLTIPAVELERWNRFFLILMPITSVLFLLLITKSISLIIDYWQYSIGAIIILLTFSFIISKYTYRNRLPNCIITLCLFSFVMSILWIWTVAKILIDILQTFGVILNISPTFLGMTLLSLGNSLPDLTLNCALAKSGFGEMGIAGSIAGPLFNLLIGLGASLIKLTSKKSIEFDIFEYKHVLLVVAGSVLLINLLRLLIQSFILKFNMTKSVSYIGYMLYFIFVVGICVFTFAFPVNPFK